MPDTTPVSPRAAAASELLSASESSADLQRLAHQALDQLHTEHALITLLTDRAVVVAAAGAGSPATGDATPFDQSYCVNVLRSDAVVCIPDASADARVSSTDAARQGRSLAYLGAPLRNPGGRLVGVLCVYDSARREWTPAEQRQLTELAEQAAAVLRGLTPATT